MSDAYFLEFFEIIQHGLAERPAIIGEVDIFVFQIDRLRLLELVIEEITVGEIGLDRRCDVRREFQGFE